VLVALASGLRGLPRLEPIVTVNVITNPALNLVLALVSLISLSLYWPTLVVLEVLVVLVEWLLLRRWLRPPPPHLVWLVVAMNATSLAAGFLILWL
jgi:hypothetical protein